VVGGVCGQEEVPEQEASGGGVPHQPIGELVVDELVGGGLMLGILVSRRAEHVVGQRPQQSYRKEND
jgi:hypothetical protein